MSDIFTAGKIAVLGFSHKTTIAFPRITLKTVNRENRLHHYPSSQTFHSYII